MRKKTFSRTRNRVNKYLNRIQQMEDRYIDLAVQEDDPMSPQEKKALKAKIQLTLSRCRNDRRRAEDAAQRGGFTLTGHLALIGRG